MIGIIVKCNHDGCIEERITSLAALTPERTAKDLSVWHTAGRLATDDGWTFDSKVDLEAAEFFCANHTPGEATGDKRNNRRAWATLR